MQPEDIPQEVFTGAAHRLTMGLRPLDMRTWLDADSDDPQRTIRAELLAERRAEVFATTPGSDHASGQVANAVEDWLGRPLPTAEHPLIRAALTVRDDLCVLTRQRSGWVLAAAVVCFPSRWLLAEKIGTDVLAIHSTVPRYREQMGRPTEAVLDKLRPDAPRWRVNWTVVNDPTLFQPRSPGGALHIDANSYLRVERQTLVRLAECIVFGIRTSVRRLSDLPDPQREAVLTSAALTPDDFRTYRGWA